jgi:ABC transport system ATP-binding/permease protein
MALLLNCREVTRQFGSTLLFENVSFTVEERERHGLIGPNGAGKSTLLSLLAGDDPPDSGEVALRKGVKLARVAQDPVFAAGVKVGDIIPPSSTWFGQAGFQDPQMLASSLSGGWRKRLALAQACATAPDVLLLDEPTNHLDLEGNLWLERVLKTAPFSSIIVSHDRYFLENVATHMAELNRVYPGGIFRVEGNYSTFLEKREQYFEAERRRREGLEAVVRREVEWLRRGAKARTRKSKARLDNAAGLIEELADMQARERTSTATIDFTATYRQTKRLVVAERLTHALGGRTLFRDLSMTLVPGLKLGLAGSNGSGKTTLLRLLLGELTPDSGAITRADNLKVVYFDQNRDQLDPSWTLKRALAPEGDSVIYQNRTIHVNGWAKRFLFEIDQLGQPVSRLSGGERARVLIARLMLREADVLLMDEPTNDLDIPTLAVLEESLTDFPGALVLVTHDRYLLDRVSTHILGLDGQGGATLYAEYAQWEEDLLARRAAPRAAASKPAAERTAPATARKRLSYIEQREYDTLEERIHAAEAALDAHKHQLQAPDVVTDAQRLEQVYKEMIAAQEEVDRLYERWTELEDKLA